MKLDNKWIESEALLQKYDFYSYNHAIDILKGSFAEEWKEIQEGLEKLEICIEDIKKFGGNKSPVPKKIDEYFLKRLGRNKNYR